jgi:hypothetical protein
MYGGADGTFSDRHFCKTLVDSPSRVATSFSLSSEPDFMIEIALDPFLNPFS